MKMEGLEEGDRKKESGGRREKGRKKGREKGGGKTDGGKEVWGREGWTGGTEGGIEGREKKG